MFDLLAIDWSHIGGNLSLIVIALVLALPIAYDRETKSNSAGLRTYPLVAVATCSYTLLALNVLDGSESMSKFMAGIVTGIGFIGGGAILKAKNDSKVTGLANAASIWNTGAMGMAVAWQKFEIAILVALINFLILRIGSEAKKVVCDDDTENLDE